MTEATQLKQRLAAPDWDMWLGLAVDVLGQLADAKDARRARKIVAAPPPVAPPAAPPVPPLVPSNRAALADLPAPDPKGMRAARRLDRAAGVLAASVLADSTLERVRREARDEALYAPIAASAVALAASLHGALDHRPGPRLGRLASFATAAAAGIASLLAERRRTSGRLPAGYLLRGAPPGIPLALAMSGCAGLLGERLRARAAGPSPRLLLFPAGRVLGTAAAAGLAGTVAQATPLLRRQAGPDPLKYLPVLVPPVPALALGVASLGTAPAAHRLARWLLHATVLAGFAGAGLRARWLARAPGGWRSWRRNVVDGGPLPTPPAYAGLAIAGLAALDLVQSPTPARVPRRPRTTRRRRTP